LFISKKNIKKQAREEKDMSEEGDTFWVTLAERLFGLFLIIIGAVLLYFTATSVNSTTDSLGPFSYLFGALSIILVLLGIFLLLVKPPE
jgi:uncharacterized protein YjeT (DUF2065 family)